VKGELKICGRNAVRAVAERRRGDILRIYLSEDRVNENRALLAWCAEERRPYRIVSTDELAKVAETVHHEGIVVAARPKPWLPFDELIAGLPKKGPVRLVLLEDVSNPHNTGAIARVAAHFGAAAIVVLSSRAGRGSEAGKALPAAAQRTAEGGLEWLELALGPELGRALEMLRGAGLVVYATSSRGRSALDRAKLEARAAFAFGSEGEGLSPAFLEAADEVLAIPGSGHVESLNVASAAAVVLAESWRRARRG
jgi:TrmH RNA methyltransferase